jgi:16S rRNA (guanine966-N2)-methyltransferase
VRVVAGKLRGTVIAPPAGLPVRPTTDRAKESLFNILTNYFAFEELNVLDLFAGTGNMSYEFCSRGANQVVAVERDFGCIQFIKQMKQKYALQELSVIKRDVFAYLQQCDQQFDIIFADPPYAMPRIHELPRVVMGKFMLQPNGWLIIEHGADLDMSNESGFFEKRAYGQSVFSFFKSIPV